MTRFAPAIVALAALLALAACSTGGASPSTQVAESSLTSTITPATASPSATPSATPTPAPPAGGSQSAAPVAIHPCALLSSAQAGMVNGVSYGAGVEHPMSNGGVECVWQNATVHASVTVQVVVWPSASEADAAYAEALAAAQGFSLVEVPGFADHATIARAGTLTGGIYVREGSIFFDVVYLRGAAPSPGQLKLTAELVLGGLPG